MNGFTDFNGWTGSGYTAPGTTQEKAGTDWTSLFKGTLETVKDYSLTRRSLDLQYQAAKQQNVVHPNLTDEDPTAKVSDPFRPAPPAANSGLIAVGVGLVAAVGLLLLARS